MTYEDMKGFRLEWEADQGPAEALILYEMLEDLKPNTIIELGIRYGGTYKVWSTLLDKDGLLIGVDMDNIIKFNIEELECNAKFVHGDSHSSETIDKIKGLLGDRQVDYLFIDGDHSKEGQQKDYTDYSSLVRDGGIIAIHDVCFDQGTIAWWKSFPHNQNVIHVDGQGYGIIIKGRENEDLCISKR